MCGTFLFPTALYCKRRASGVRSIPTGSELQPRYNFYCSPLPSLWPIIRVGSFLVEPLGIHNTQRRASLGLLLSCRTRDYISSFLALIEKWTRAHHGELYADLGRYLRTRHSFSGPILPFIRTSRLPSTLLNIDDQTTFSPTLFNHNYKVQPTPTPPSHRLPPPFLTHSHFHSITHSRWLCGKTT